MGVEMINHIVMIKTENKDNIRKVVEKFELLDEVMPEIQRIDINYNCYERETNFDVMFVLAFNNVDDLAQYISSEVHVDIANNQIKPLVTNLVAIDIN